MLISKERNAVLERLFGTVGRNRLKICTSFEKGESKKAKQVVVRKTEPLKNQI